MAGFTPTPLATPCSVSSGIDMSTVPCTSVLNWSEDEVQILFESIGYGQYHQQVRRIAI